MSEEIAFKSIVETPATEVIAEEDEEDYSPVQIETLPLKDKDLPPIIREIVTNAPKNRKIPSFIASMSPLCALASRIRVHYYHDNRPHALLLQVVIEGAQSSGKSFAADIERLIMNDTLKARDEIQRRIEQDYKEKKKRRRANETLEEEPKTTIRVIPPTISKTVLTKRADMYNRIYGDTLTFWMFAEELAQVTDAGKTGYSNLRTIMRTAYDLGSEFGLDYASDNSYSAITDINICSMFCATPSALDEYYDKKAIEGGNITRCIICPIDDDIRDDDEYFLPYSDEQMKIIRHILDLMLNDSYDADDHLQPTKSVDMGWIDRDCKRFIKNKGKEFSLTGSDAVKVFRKRSSVSAFRIAALCYYLYSLENGFDPTVPVAVVKEDEEQTEEDKNKLKAQKRCRKIYQYMSEFIIKQMLKRWEKRYNYLNSKRNDSSQSDDTILFDMLPNEFTREGLKQLIEHLGCTTPAKQFIWMWGPKKMRIIEAVDKNHFKKVDLSK